MTNHELDPDAVAERLELLRTLCEPQRITDPPVHSAPGTVDMSPEAVAWRLEELRQLWRFTQLLGGRVADR